MVKLLLLSMVLIFFVGCTAIQEAALSLDSPGERGLRCDSEEDGKTWNLGTGRIEDIGRHAPGFFTRNNGKARARALTPKIDGVTEVRPAVLDGSDAFEIVTKDVPYKIRAFRIDNRVGILVTPGACPNVRATDHCGEGGLKTSVTAAGTVKCLGPFSLLGDHVEATLGSDTRRVKIVLGEPFFEPSKAATAVLYLYYPGENKPFANVSRMVDDRSDVLPEEVIAILRHGGLERPASLLFKGIPHEQMSSEVAERVTKARVAGARKAMVRVENASEMLGLIKVHTKGAMPGDDETFAVLGVKIREAVGQLIQDEATPENLILIFTLTDFFRKTIGEAIDISALEAKYEPLMVQPAFKADKYQGAFILMFPESQFAKALHEEDAKAMQQAEAESKKREASIENEFLWQEVRARGDEIATLAYKIRFGQQNFVNTKHNRRGLESMRKYREGIIRDAFCPAKRKMVKALGAAEYQKVVTEHCRTQAPVEAGVGGVEITITNDCHTAFATGC